ncbi:hypothetical protein [Streptomyces sp. CBMA156]|uniref:hypothetical protein n=1 Tax=Streptomyces sp. CBMA156 TaxID=1930280 RepID=UPI0016619921|nr:hypothetical protein [Streptomyces sp. CBMA156]MBD0669997.1 hypothetical protein [Streptomyces sp. CBMA156]MBD0674525.1 hypothetical protein [Streptomyces sp. CBMA156]
MDQHDETVSRIERLRRREELLYNDIVIAQHKGYGSSGSTESEIHEELQDIATAIEQLQSDLDEEYH